MMGARRRLLDEQGTSLIELVVVLGLLSIVGVMIAQSMLSSVRASDAGENRSFTLADTRTALERIERDIRAANPIDLPTDPLADSSYYDSNLSFSIYCSAAGVGTCGADHFRHVTWRVVGNSLERLEGTTVGFELGPAGPAGFPADQQRDAVVNPAGRPVFQYHDASGQLMVTGSGGLVPDQFRHCAREVVVTLVTNAESSPAPATIDLTTTATIRNDHKVTGC